MEDCRRMKTITVQIGNSDDKLTQEEWSKFVEATDKIIHYNSRTIHFWGGSVAWVKWQNVAWIFECEEEKISVLKDALWLIRSMYKQDSIAYTEGDTQFI